MTLNEQGSLTETDCPTDQPTRERLPYMALYSVAVRKLMAGRDRVAKDVLESLAMCANPIGLCYPGVGYIADEIGAADKTVLNALERLEQMGFIRVYKTVNVLRGRESIDYQISPYVLYISDAYIDRAFELWHTNIDNSESKESQPTPKNQNQNLTTGRTNYREPTPPTNSRLGTAVRDYYANSGAPTYRRGGYAAGNPAPAGANPTAPRGATFPPPSSAPPPSAPRLVSYDAPLPDEAAELVAARMNVDTGYRLSVANARGLVVRYGAARCEAGLAHLENQTDVKNPAALLRWYIEGGHVDPLQDGKHQAHDWPTSTNQYTSGKNAAFFSVPDDESEDKNA
jgi:hypothetical protein